MPLWSGVMVSGGPVVLIVSVGELPITLRFTWMSAF